MDGDNSKTPPGVQTSDRAASEGGRQRKYGKNGRYKGINPLAKKYGHHVQKKTASSESRSALSKKIRDTERTLKRPGINATTKQELERRIKALRVKIDVQDTEAREQKLYEKYKYVRFVESKKITRKIAQTERQLQETPATASRAKALAKELAELKVKLAYTKHYPADEKYISLFPKEPLAPDAPSAARQARILELVRSAQAEGLFEKPGFVLRLKDARAESGTDQDGDEDNGNDLEDISDRVSNAGAKSDSDEETTGDEVDQHGIKSKASSLRKDKLASSRSGGGPPVAESVAATSVAKHNKAHSKIMAAKPPIQAPPVVAASSKLTGKKQGRKNAPSSTPAATQDDFFIN
ncbi:hypothetical protein HK105_206928 [Polyrhizophydium stewartii]|uniref:rRNA-processing protein EFG1 n=1 Tax=Polyrhizophydium stewartii TaxID=2732419 RepID=A0ABR4N275_9FUNG